MHSKIKEWNNHPVTQAFIKVLIDLKLEATDSIMNVAPDAPRDIIIRNIERLRVLNELSDFETLLLGELEDEREIKGSRTTN